ncbi:MAG: radical SAM protein [Candidatus Omnitrophota bacterium]|nr:MAG: radical SAM protein [Candidatus Omnitrophota bacterium]
MDNQQYKSKLYYSCKDTYSKEWNVIAPAPAKIMFELTNVCNHRCFFCANSVMKRKAGYMKGEVFRHIAKEALNLGVKELALYTTGESLLHPEIVEFTKTAKEIGFTYVYLSSNAVLLNAQISRGLIEAGLDSLRISINAGSKESYRRIHGSDDFEKVIKNIKMYDEIRKRLKKNTLLSASCVLTKFTESEKENLERSLKPYVDAIKWTDVRVQGGKMIEVIQKSSVRSDDPRNCLKPCGLLWNGMHVDYEGNLTLCCVDFDGVMTVGNILKQGLMECWNGPLMQEQRRLHLTRALEPQSLCYRCLTGTNHST